jgi:hypothetical protein
MIWQQAYTKDRRHCLSHTSHPTGVFLQMEQRRLLLYLDSKGSQWPMTRRMDRRETAGRTATIAAGCHDWRTFRWKSTSQKKYFIPSNHFQTFRSPPNRTPHRIHLPRLQADRHQLPQQAHKLPLQRFRHHQTLRRSKHLPSCCIYNKRWQIWRPALRW